MSICCLNKINKVEHIKRKKVHTSDSDKNSEYISTVMFTSLPQKANEKSHEMGHVKYRIRLIRKSDENKQKRQKAGV